MFFDYGSYVKEQECYQEMLSQMALEVEEFMGEFHDDPRWLSGWGHNYFCEKDGARLVYDRKRPLEHCCSICGKIYTDFAYATYFTTMYRNEVIETAVKAAVLFEVTREPVYCETVKNIVSFYANNYKYFAVHAKDKLSCSTTIDVGGAGKMMPQGLNEAIVAIRMINALEVIKRELKAEWLTEIKQKLFVPMYELLLPQKMHIHNIPIWLNSAFGIMGLFFEEEEWVKEATDHPFNIYEQLDNGLTASGFWYEGSIHYNFFALEGLMTFLVFAKSYRYGIEKTCLNKVKHMLFAAYEYAFDNDLFPNPSDGWPNISLKTYSYVYFMGYKVFGDDVLPLLHHIMENPLERGKLPLSEPYYYRNEIALAQMMYAADYMEKLCTKPTKRTSAEFADYNCAILRNGIFNVFLKYGHQTTSHAHPDKMNVEIMVRGKVLTRDLSNSGYGTKICNEWNRTIFAHNTCAVNGNKSDIKHEGKMLYFSDREIRAEAQPYEGVTYQRNLHIDGVCLKDEFRVSCKEESNVDYFFHFETEVNRENLALQKAVQTDNPYFMDIVKIAAKQNEIELENELVRMRIYLEEGASAYLMKTYNNPANLLRDTLVIRKRGREACYYSEIYAK